MIYATNYTKLNGNAIKLERFTISCQFYNFWAGIWRVPAQNNGIYLTNIGISPRKLLGGPQKNRGFSETRHPICANVCWDIYKWGIFAKSYDIPSMGLKPTSSSGAHDTRPKNLTSKLMNAWIWST